MLSIGVRVVGEGLALDIVDAFLAAQFEGGRHAARVEMLDALEP
jgi:ribose 5-phosphate isomerase B